MSTASVGAPPQCAMHAAISEMVRYFPDSRDLADFAYEVFVRNPILAEMVCAMEDQSETARMLKRIAGALSV